MFQQVALANFGIERIRRSHYDESISELLVYHRDAKNNVISLGWYSRHAIIDSLERGNAYITITLTRPWTRGADIYIVNVNGKKYLRTDRSLIASDDLGNLPEE
jgi:hypothetical protein